MRRLRAFDSVMFAGILVAFLASGCAEDGADRPEDLDGYPVDDGKPPVDPRCAVYTEPAKVAQVDDPVVDEMSGLAASAQHEGVLWTHNDSGGGPYIYALDGSGEVQARVKAKGAAARDWEDIALGPCNAGDGPSSWKCLYVGDTGDNSKKHPTGAIVQIPEPSKHPERGVDGPEAITLTVGTWRSWTFIWPDGPRNVESLAMMQDRRAILLTRDSDSRFSQVWRVDLNGSGDPVAEKLGELDMANEEAETGPTVTVGGADLSPSGESLLVRTQKDVYLFEVGGALRLPAAEAAKALAAAKRETLPHGHDAMAESVAWDRKKGYWTTSEAVKGVIPRLWRTACAVD